MLAYAFLAGLLVRVKQLLQTSSSVNLLALKLLEQTRAILKDDTALEEPIIAAVQGNQSSVRAPPVQAHALESSAINAMVRAMCQEIAWIENEECMFAVIKAMRQDILFGIAQEMRPGTRWHQSLS